MPLTGTPGVECRSGGASGNHTLVFTFKSNLASGEVSVTSGAGSYRKRTGNVGEHDDGEPNECSQCTEDYPYFA